MRTILEEKTTRLAVLIRRRDNLDDRIKELDEEVKELEDTELAGQPYYEPNDNEQVWRETAS